jgi:hypothetical protein
MQSLSQIPEWLGTAIAGAVSAIVGFFSRNLWDWYKKHYESRGARRERLEHLDRLLDESRNLFRSQRAQAQRLLESISQSDPSVQESDLSLDQIFSRAFAQFLPEEKQLHSIVRGVTATSLRRVNQEMSDWLSKDDWFKQPKHKTELHNRLARELQQLELHLNEWHAKFLYVFEEDRTIALNYLADEQRQGTGFPQNIESLVKQVLGRDNS